MLVSVLLLVKNAEQLLDPLLSALETQAFVHSMEVLAIDSGSTDGTREILRIHAARCLEITPESFNHGETRNLAAREADPESDYLVYLSQDALPADEHWLENLIRPLEEDPQVAGAFSRHIPRPGASPTLVRQLTTHWQTGGTERIMKQIPEDPAEYERRKGFFTYFSNTSSAIRRSVWEQIPFRQLDFAEDADWADRALRAGYKIVFEPDSVVIHSHDYSIIEQFRQNVDHTEAMVAIFDPPVFRDRWLLLKQLRSLPREVWRDLKFMGQSPYFAGCSRLQKIAWALRSPFWYLASFLGAWFGARLQKLPESWRIFLGRQERLKLGNTDR
jgi:rhamnosyltransferase